MRNAGRGTRIGGISQERRPHLLKVFIIDKSCLFDQRKSDVVRDSTSFPAVCFDLFGRTAANPNETCRPSCRQVFSPFCYRIADYAADLGSCRTEDLLQKWS